MTDAPMREITVTLATVHASLAWAFDAESAADSTLHVSTMFLCKRRIACVDCECVGARVAIICCMLMGLSTYMTCCGRARYAELLLNEIANGEMLAWEERGPSPEWTAMQCTPVAT